MVGCGTCGEPNPEYARFCLACGTPLPEHPSSGARRVVTVLFCDLVGSTEMSAGLDPESMRWILDRYFGLIKSIVDRHGGRVEKFIGDAALAVFGLPRVHEDDALRAVDAAVAIRDAVARLDRELQRDRGIRLQTRIGVNTGEVLSADPKAEAVSITGGPINLAARLEQVAKAGEIVVGDETIRLVRDAVTAEEMSPVLLKGFAEPMRVHRLLSVVPGARGHSRRFDPPLVDRDAEQALLEKSFDRVVTGRRCQLFTILGPPGIGKSRLVEEFVRDHEHDVTALSGRCLPYGDGITFWPISEIVHRAAGLNDDDPPEAAVAKIGALVAGIDRDEVVAQRVGQTLGVAEGTPSPDEISWAIRRLFEALGRSSPLVLVFDDIHWGEPNLLDLIEHVADRSRDAPIMLVCVARPELLDARGNWGAGLPNATTILLDPLAPSDADAMLGNLLSGAELEAATRARIVEVASGYPLFVEEIVTHLIDDGALVREGDTWGAPRDISDLAAPPSISALLASRLDRLEPGERAVAERASLIGRDFLTTEVLAISPEWSEDEVLRDLESLVRKELIRAAPASMTGASGSYGFRHLLLRDAAYDGIRKSTRAELHERYATWLEGHEGARIEPYQEIVAYHLEQAYRYRAELGPMDEDVERLALRAGAHAAAAGRRAAARGDMPATVKLLGKAASLMPNDDPERLSFLPNLADSLFQTGDRDQAETILDGMIGSAARIGDPVLEARARMDRYTWQLITDPMAISGEGLRQVVDDAMDVFERSRDPEQLAAGLEATGIVHRFVTGDITAMAEAGERGLLLGDAGSPAAATSGDILAQALVVGATACDAALSRLEELSRLFASEPMVLAAIDLRTATVLAMLERFGEARARAGASCDVFDELSQLRWTAEAAHVIGLIEWWEGDAAAAEEAMRAAHRSFVDRGEATDAALVATDLAQVLFDLGRYADADAMARSIARDAPSFALEPRIGWRRITAKIAATSGDRAEAEVLAREAVRLASPTDFLTVQSEALADLAYVLGPDAQREAIDAALERCARKGNLAGARRARSVRERASAAQL